MYVRRWAVVAAVGCTLAVCCGNVRANPSHNTLDALLAVHGQEFSPELLRTATGVYEESSRKLRQFLEHEQKDAIQRIDANDLGTTHVLATRLRRAGAQLRMLGEPTGIDLELRAGVIHGHLGRLIGKAQAVPATQKYINAFRQFIAKTAQARAKVIQDLEKLISQQKFDAAEAELYKVYDRLELGTVFLTPEENRAIYQPFNQVDPAIQDGMRQRRVAKAKELLTAAVASSLPNYASILQEFNTAIAAVGTAGKADWQGESVTGPQLVERIGQRWREAEVGALQARAKYSALMLDHGSINADTMTSDAAANDRFAADFANFSGQVTQAIGRLLEADAERLSGEEVVATYIAYLNALAPLARQVDRAPFANAMQASLQRLSARHATLPQQVEAYGLATNELLRWRARVAAAAAARRADEFAAIDNRMREGTTSQPELVGLFPQPPANQPVPLLLYAAPDIMAASVPRLIGQKTAVTDLIRLPGESKAAIARFTGQTYANVPVVDLAAAVEGLKYDLLVSEQAPPLTLIATQSLMTAQRGDLRGVGGAISGTYLESVVTRFASLPSAAAILVPLGQLPAKPYQGDPLRQMLMRFDITPEWIWHDHFFVQTTPAAAY